MKAPKTRKGFERIRMQTEITGESQARQEFKDECDVNNIMKKFTRTQLIDHRNQYQGNYGDFTTTAVDYHDAMNIVKEAEDMFMSVPAEIRSEFNNDAGEFVKFVENPENNERLVELGLATSSQLDIEDVIASSVKKGMEGAETAPEAPSTEGADK